MARAKKSVKKKEKRGISIGLILGIIGIICFIMIYTLSSFFGFSIAFCLILLMGIFSITGLVYSIKDKKKKKKGALIGIILNIMVLGTWTLIVIWIFWDISIDPPTPRGECFSAIDQIEIDTSSEYTCYYLEDGHAIVNLSVKRGAERLDLEGFVILIYGEGRNDRFEISNVPERRETITYSLTTTNLTEITSVEISPIVEGNIYCDAADRKPLHPC